MPRRNRIEYGGAVYHVMDRGDRAENIFINERDRKNFLKTLGEVCERTGWCIHAFVLMDNHYHLLVETPEPNLVKGMQWLQATYTIRFNTRHQMCGHLFQGRYKAIPVDAEDKSYFQRASDYIHLNPVRAKMIKPDATLEQYPWSSFPLLIGSPKLRPAWLAAQRTLYQGDTSRDREAYRKHIMSRVAAERDDDLEDEKDKDIAAERKAMRRGWYIGSPDFRDQLDEILEKEGKELKKNEHCLAEAERLCQLALKYLKISESDLKKMKKGRKEKVLIAALIKTRTTLTGQWIATRLSMGGRTYVSTLCAQVSEKEIQDFMRKIEH